MKSRLLVETKYYPALARLFSPIVMRHLLDTGKSEYMSEVLETTGLIQRISSSTTVRQFITFMYSHISRAYQAEYVYKNVIANRILLGKHSLDRSSMITEFRVGGCKADVVILNGTSTVYEIKSQYDCLDRIEKQIEAYAEVFDIVNVISTGSQLVKIEAKVSPRVGLFELTPRNAIHTTREGVSCKASTKPEAIFECLRRSEYLSIITKCLGPVPAMPNTRVHAECKKLFCSISPEVAHDEMVTALHNRKENRLLREFIGDVPQPLKAYFIGTGIDSAKFHRLTQLLDTNLMSIVTPP